MFNFDQVLSLSIDRDTGNTIATHYDIVAARLSTETYDRSSNGYNLYEADLNSVDSESDEEIHGLTIAVGNKGNWVNIQKDLNPLAEYETDPGVFQQALVDALVEGKLLIVTDTGASIE